MNLAWFIVYTVIGSSIWNSILIGAGWLLGANWQAVEGYVKYFQYVVLAVVVVAALWFIWKRWSTRNNVREVAAPADTQASGPARRR